MFFFATTNIEKLWIIQQDNEDIISQINYITLLDFMQISIANISNVYFTIPCVGLMLLQYTKQDIRYKNQDSN